MNQNGLYLNSRFSYPPNLFSLCGPEKQKDLKWYTLNKKTDLGTKEILSQFSTLYPYLKLIAQENNIKDPFNYKVAEAYWLGNDYLENVSFSSFAELLTNTLNLRKKTRREVFRNILEKASFFFFPHHSYHVLNLYKRTGNIDSDQTLKIMDACIINWGKVVSVNNSSIVVQSKPLCRKHGKIEFGKKTLRSISVLDKKDLLLKDVKVNDFIAYHWGYYCLKLSKKELRNLSYYTRLSLKLSEYKLQ